ncbi:hypothetical protein EI555_015740 [Monodon monoceros]|uniref:Uncharacterized protein n=1 Tax=Monodon monoceros TaxID=40151 RepID=A0A4U1F5V9_MONMO|nr:hypothetical protein EI555_015740 [Monodon monoceros]
MRVDSTTIQSLGNAALLSTVDVEGMKTILPLKKHVLRLVKKVSSKEYQKGD